MQKKALPALFVFAISIFSACIPAGPKAADSDVDVDVLVINGNYYPVSQFTLAKPDKCDAEHWHAHDKVYPLYNAEGIWDPNPGGCGFGKVSEVKRQEVEVENDILESFESIPK